MKIADKTAEWKHGCGCTYKRDGFVWKINEYCDEHSPNFQKKADKIMRRENKKRGKGWTKPDKKKK